MSDDQKKDFTTLAEYSKAHADEIPVPESGEVLSEQPIEQVQDFESLDDYAKTNPAPEASAESPAADFSASDNNTDFPVTATEEGGPDSSLQLSGIHDSPAESEFAGIEPSQEQPSQQDIAFDSPPDTPDSLGLDSPQEPTPEFPSDLSGAVTGQAESLGQSDALGPTDVPPQPEPPSELAGIKATRSAPEGVYVAPESKLEAAQPPRESLSAAFAATQPAPTPPPRTAAHATPAMPPVPAALPFSVLIRGQLKPDEQNRLLELLEKENYGITAKDLETQLRGDRILLPRISEYAAVLVVQALRSADVVIQAAPSDEIFSTEDTRDQLDDPLLAPPAIAEATTFDAEHPSEDIPILVEPLAPEQNVSEALDVVTASLGIKSMALELRRSAEFNDALEALKREIRRKAHRRGAHAITGFKLQIDRLDLPSHYRVSVLGTAVKHRALK